jgi:hypothetical protein
MSARRREPERNEPSVVAVHEFVQLLAGWVPDEELAAVRRKLADGQPAAAAAAAVAMAAERYVPLRAQDIETATALAGGPDALDDVQPVEQYPPLPFLFSVYGPDERLEADDLDQVMMEAAQARGEQIAGLWRTWRIPQDGDEDEGSAFRVYLAQVATAAAAPAIAAELQAAMNGQEDVGVEAVALDAVLRPYQAEALDCSVLLWAADDAEVPVEDDGPPFKIARVFDFAKPDAGPGFLPEHRVVTDSAERDRMLAYLASGTPVLYTTARTQDIVDPAAGQVVPTSFRSDGEWIWTDTVTYYLEQHGLAPDEELAAHIEARWQAGETSAEIDSQTAVDAANFLLYPPPEHAREAAWTPGTSG